MDAGYILPDGTYYSLNGLTRDLLHITIVDSLIDQKIIINNTPNIDYQLEQKSGLNNIIIQLIIQLIDIWHHYKNLV